MFEHTSPFFQRSKRIAEDFLQTTLIVDDQAYFEEEIPAKEATTAGAAEIVTPGRKSGRLLNKETLTEPAESTQPIGSHRLNAQKVINSFAQKRIVCSVIKPANNNDYWINSVENLAVSADIVIVDWDLHNDNGENALNILEHIIKSAVGSPEQLRLFAIYTGDPGIAQIALQIKNSLEKRLEIVISSKDEGFSLVFNSTKIVIFAKPDTLNLPSEYQDRKVKFEDLADRVTTEFTVMTSGLVSNAVIKSLTQVRLNTRKILSVFSKILNAPYLTHRALLPVPEDAEVLINSLIAKELQGIIEESHAGIEGNLEAIADWLTSQNNNLVINAKFEETTLSFDTKEKMLLLLQKGIREAIEQDGIVPPALSSKTKRKEFVRKIEEKLHTIPFTQSFSTNETESEFADEMFAHVTTMRSYYIGNVPKLTLGTILKGQENNSYWVCLQPRCDCVRITGERNFLFLPLLQVRSKKEKFDIVVLEDNRYLRLALNYKPYKLNLIVFAPRTEDSGVIAARKVNSTYQFVDTSNILYTWLGELRSEHAQRIANEFASKLSRVGLDESEWLRLWATNGS